MNRAVVTKDVNLIRKMGIEALIENLGPVGMIEFMGQFDSGYGDYVNDRHNWLDNLTIDEICDEIAGTDFIKNWG